jgi:hypothetical protein
MIRPSVLRHGALTPLCLSGRLAAFARLTVQDGPDGCPRFRLYRPHPLAGEPPVRFSEATLCPGHPDADALLEADQDA